jgi:hypothetical protein
MTAGRDDAACTGAVVRKPPVKERAMVWGERKKSNSDVDITVRKLA